MGPTDNTTTTTNSQDIGKVNHYYHELSLFKKERKKNGYILVTISSAQRTTNLHNKPYDGLKSIISYWGYLALRPRSQGPALQIGKRPGKEVDGSSLKILQIHAEKKTRVLGKI